MYKACRDNKFNKCRARFPREVRESTLVDPETGGILMKHGHEWMNTITPLLTYIFRCNTDVTCLLSGTAVKAVLIYVSDYITKSALKTYAMFECIRSVLDNNIELIHSESVDSTQKARMLMTKIANQLSAQMELGSPMICMYLLGNPDRYTAHHFETFFWKSYVNEVRLVWDRDEPSLQTERVSLMEKQGGLKIVSTTQDYVYRPEELSDMSLYDFIRWCKREKRTKPRPEQSAQGFDDDASYSGDGIWEGSDVEPDQAIFGRKQGIKGNKTKSSVLEFLPDHPLNETHVCRRLNETNLKRQHNRIVVNFVGGTPPRRDGSDTEYYYCAMLTFFSPWRSGKDLRGETETWSAAFHRETFDEEYTRVMNNFHLRYECLDSRDDFRAQMAAGDGGYIHPFLDLNGDEPLDEDNELGDVEGHVDEMSVVDLLSEPSRKEKSNRVGASLLTELLTAIGWSVPGDYPALQDPVKSDQIPRLPSNRWADLVKAERDVVINSRRRDLPPRREVDSKYSFVFTGVRVIDKSYLERDFLPQSHLNLQEDVAHEFSLNEDQDRAFRMVSSHARHIRPDQLNLYIGGMGGTGKSQVLHALKSFFASSDETHRIMVVAPTGNAASLIDGTTYHYAFGLNMPDTSATLVSVQERLRGVDYIFFDEISMCSSHDLYKISSKLCRISGRRDVVFGGFNMIFAGDFAQLPPPIGGELVSLYSDGLRRTRRSRSNQEQAIGQVAWHMVTNVVILRQNMRQKSRTMEDARFRAALENMRYKSCSNDDIQFLKTLSCTRVGRGRESGWQEFDNASIITGLNTNRDTINDIGVRRFAAERHLELVSFYSEDTCQDIEDNPLSSRKRNRNSSRKVSSRKFSVDIQNLVWEQPSGANSKKIAGKLMLCYGLPVMLKHNFATELGMVNGQRGTIYGWHEGVGSFGQRVLDVLFVRITDPVKTVRIPNLPDNIVPIVRTSNNTDVRMPNGHSFSIVRQQVEISYDFAMTDYASQGYTRIMNPVNLSDLRTHQGYYTALSRSSTAKGTVIIQGFDVRKITGGCSPALRREFRELEILDAITKQRFEGNLPFQVEGSSRRQLISRFLETLGNDYSPLGIHSALKWIDPGDLLGSVKTAAEDDGWRIVEDSKPDRESQKYVPAKGSNDNKTDELINSDRKPKKKRQEKLLASNASGSAAVDQIPLGVRWHRNSCAYDSVLIILYNVWHDHFHKRPLGDNAILVKLVSSFRRVDIGEHDLCHVQHRLKGWLNSSYPEQFVPGEFASVVDIAQHVLSSPITVLESVYICPHGHQIANKRRTVKEDSLFFSVAQSVTSTQDVLPKPSQKTKARCVCKSNLVKTVSFLQSPLIIAMDLSSTEVGCIDAQIVINSGGGESRYRLSGLVYFGGYHFTARYIDCNDVVWQHDGLLRDGCLVRENTDDLHYLHGRKVSLAFYVLLD